MTQKTITILGSTGSIGSFTLDIVKANPDKFKVFALTADKNLSKLVAQAAFFKPAYIVIGNPQFYEPLKKALSNTGIKVLAGFEAIIQIAKLKVDCVVSAIVGANGLLPTMAAINAGQKVALANKESLVCAGNIMMDAVSKYNAQLLPVDSEHNALFQLLQGHNPAFVDHYIITASGGPFRDWSIEQMAKATPQQAVKHPNWDMGSKISVDSASLMNKGLELIEAARLFDLNLDQLDAFIHPQSFFHGILRFIDGSHFIYAAQPDMRIPISYALSYPDRLDPPIKMKSTLAQFQNIEFLPIDENKFPCIRIAKEALKMGKNTPTILNAANEIAVEAFLGQKIGFLDIPKLIEDVLASMPLRVLETIKDVLDENNNARAKALELLPKRAA